MFGRVRLFSQPLAVNFRNCKIKQSVASINIPRKPSEFVSITKIVYCCYLLRISPHNNYRFFCVSIDDHQLNKSNKTKQKIRKIKTNKIN